MTKPLPNSERSLVDLEAGKQQAESDPLEKGQVDDDDDFRALSQSIIFFGLFLVKVHNLVG